MDNHRFPKLQEYLSGLPDGLDSYPDCVAKASLLLSVLEERTGDGPVDGLPARVADCIANPPLASTWIPEALLVAAHFALMDVDGYSTEVIMDLTYRANRRLTESRMYRALAKVASPQLLIRGASMSWRLMHKGVILSATARRRQARVVVTHPRNLWTRLVHESSALGFRAVVEAAHGRDVKSEVIESGPEAAEFEVRWS